ncbi:Uncharacterised protein [Mycobacteroides abscessus]|nr:Uncharacterised protein [Mycobacteroides abscessus]
MHVGIRTVAVAAVCGLCVGAGVDARAVRPNLSIAGTPTTRSVSSQAVSLASFSDLLAAAAPQNDAAAQMNSVGGGAVSSTDLIGTVAKLLATPNITQSGVTPGINTAAVGTVDPPSSEPVDPPTGQPTDPPAADEPAPPTNFPGERPAFGTPSYFAQLAFAVFHVVALPITVPVQFFLGSAEGVPTVIAAAINDLSGLLGQIPGLSPQQPTEPQPQQIAQSSSPLQKQAAAETGPTTDPEPPAEPLPTNFPGPRPAFGTPSYFAQLAFAVLHVLALPITVPVQAIIGKTEGVPSVIVAALNDLSSLLGQVPKLSAPVTDTKTTPQDSTSRKADKAAPTLDSASEKPETATSGADAKTSKIERNEHEGKTADKAAEVPKAEHETKPGAASEGTPKTDSAKEVVESKADPTKVVLSSLLGQVPKLSAPVTDTKTTPQDSTSRKADKAAPTVDSASEKPGGATSGADAKASKIERNEHEGKTADKAAEAPKAEHETKPGAASEGTPKTDSAKEVVESKADPTLSSLLGQVPKPSAPVTDTKTTPQDSTSQQADKAAPTVDSASEKPGGATSGADAKASKIERNEHEGKTADKAAEVPKAEHETKPGAASEETPKTDPAKEVVEPKVDPAKVVESKTDPTKAVEPKADPTKVVEPQVVEPKVDPAKAVEPKTDPAKAVEPKADAAAEPAKPESSKPESSKAEVAKPVTAKPETKVQPAKPESAGPVKVTRDSLKSTPGETGTTGGTKTTEGSKGSVTDSKTPAASTDTKVHDGLKPAVGAKPDKPADKPSTEKSSSEKSGSSSEGSSHSSESKSHSSEGKSHSGSKD